MLHEGRGVRWLVSRWFWKGVSFPLAVAVLVSLKSCYDKQQQEIGKRDAELYSNQQKIGTLQRRVQILEDSLQVKIRVAYRTKLKYDTLLLQVPALERPDAAPVPAKQLASVILVGKEAIETCHSALSVCETLLPVKDSIIRYQQQQLTILNKRVPNGWDEVKQWGWRLLFFEVGRRIK